MAVEKVEQDVRAMVAVLGEVAYVAQCERVRYHDERDLAITHIERLVLHIKRNQLAQDEAAAAEDFIADCRLGERLQPEVEVVVSAMTAELASRVTELVSLCAEAGKLLGEFVTTYVASNVTRRGADHWLARFNSEAE
jgi:hypothetical protein